MIYPILESNLISVIKVDVPKESKYVNAQFTMEDEVFDSTMRDRGSSKFKTFEKNFLSAVSAFRFLLYTEKINL